MFAASLMAKRLAMRRVKIDVKGKTQQAIYNNNGLYEAIFSARKIEFKRNDLIRYSLEKTPPLYSNLVTLSKDWKPDDVFRAIDTNYEREKWEEWSIKDSFGVLDLTEYGFTKLFDARWIYLEAGKFAPYGAGGNLRYAIISSEDVLAAWRKAWDADEQLGKEIFSRKLLDDSKVYFVAGHEGKLIVSGCFVNRTDDVLGVSNFFAPDRNVKYWSEMIDFIFSSIGRMNIVGYERKELTDKLQTLGFETVGDLTVWLKKRNS
jgi:hypothetical protein